MNITWVNCLHLYQPPWQSPEVVSKVSEESYEWLLSLLEKNPRFHVTCNIAGTLLEALETSPKKIIPKLRSLVAKGRIELTGTAKFHALLPRLPEREIQRQIDLQEQTLNRFFPGIKLTGFFLPELAYNKEVGMIIKKRGYQWIILDPISTSKKIDDRVRYVVAGNGLTVLFRNAEISRSYPPEKIHTLLQDSNKVSHTIITATDAELYGHSHHDWQDHLSLILQDSRVITKTISEYIQTVTTSETVNIRSASWNTKHHEIQTNNPFNIWYNLKNPIHRDLWRLAYKAMNLMAQHEQDPNFQWARHHLDRGLASCSWWWASEIKTSPFAPVGWSPDEIEKGALELIKSIRSLTNLPTQEKTHAEKIYSNLLNRVWTHHWKTYASQ